MKIYRIILISLLVSFLPTQGNSISEIELNSFSDTTLNRAETLQNQIVYVCTGSYAYAYHSRSDCPGLGNCKGDIKYTDEYTAVNQLGRVPCCRCWSNVQNRCKDDNPNYNTAGGGGGGGESEVLAVIFIAAVAAGAILISNDFYFYKSVSFKNQSPYDWTRSGLENGWSFGLRKTFDQSAIECGLTHLKSKITNLNFQSSYYYKDRWGGNLNYVHRILEYHAPEDMEFYIGPTINIYRDFGYGGILGAKYMLFDRLFLDARYEFSTQTHHFQFGLILTYQKEYFWKRR